MRKDLNFFSPYYGRKKEGNKGFNNTAIYIAVGVVLVAILGISLYQGIDYYFIKADVKDYQDKLSDPAFLAKLNETEKAEKEQSNLNKYNEGLTSLTNAVDSRMAVKAETLNALSSTLVKDVGFTDVAIDKEKISLKAEASDRTSLGELEHNLKDLDIMQDVHVGNIKQKSDNVFTCDIDCSLKDVE